MQIIERKLKVMEDQKGENMTTEEVIQELKISRATLYNRIKAGEIKPIKSNSALRKQPLLFKREDVEKLKRTND